MDEKSKSRLGEAFTHFVSLEVKYDPDYRAFLSQVEEIQATLLSMFPQQQGKPAKMVSLHVTLATLLIKEDEMAYVIQSLADAVDQFKRVYSGEDGIRCDFQGISTHKDVVFLNMALGGNACKTFRDILMFNGLQKFTTDQTETPHVTYMKKMNLNSDEKDSMQKMMEDVKTTRITFDTVALRERKNEILKPPVREYGLWRD